MGYGDFNLPPNISNLKYVDRVRVFDPNGSFISTVRPTELASVSIATGGGIIDVPGYADGVSIGRLNPNNPFVYTNSPRVGLTDPGMAMSENELELQFVPEPKTAPNKFHIRHMGTNTMVMVSQETDGKIKYFVFPGGRSAELKVAPSKDAKIWLLMPGDKGFANIAHVKFFDSDNGKGNGRMALKVQRSVQAFTDLQSIIQKNPRIPGEIINN